ncbi:hypothetical protein F443_22641 [Phytophthora nicotianae P1569]|uniref:Uncharacterized protein n=1 Tax=Phytophthora nicotianae P1569 TaxID=1317065 RepID=V9DUB1_PHYNI|nr:hypothetical protein F443_22641 [Phytophthora nicotianae P1569]
MAKGPRKETRSEHQRFLTGLQGRSVEERERLQKEYKAYLAGEGDQDVSFDREPAPTVPTQRPALHRPPPLGKDFAYLQAQERLISQQHRAVAAKTVAGSGRKAPVARKTKEQDEDYVPDEEEDLTPPSTEDLLEIREPPDERAQPNAPVAELPEDESISTGTTGSGFLESDCEDTEAEICFLDDDDELERARSETTGVNTADESSLLSDSEAESNHDDDADPNDQDCAETLADSHPPRAWNVLPKHEMVDFAKDLNNMAEMRASGWTLVEVVLYNIF